MDFKPFCNTDIRFINIEDMKQALLSIDMNNIVFVMSGSAVSRLGFESFIDELHIKCADNNGTLIWIKDLESNPTSINIYEALTQVGNKQVDIIIAVGGGSAIDLAKAISAFYKNDADVIYSVKEIKDSIINKNYQGGNFVDIIALPTTAGTGSEITQWATIWDEDKKSKYSIDDSGLKPKLAIIVPELTLSMPPDLTLITGLDAMCHSIEAYWSKYTTPIVQEIAYRAIEIVVENLRKAVDYSTDLTVRRNLCKASVLAGIAFSQTRTTACHSISYPLTMFYDVPHGIAASITLDAVGKLNKGYFFNDDRLFEMFAEYKGIKGYIDSVCEDVVDVDVHLSAYGVTIKDIPKIVKNAFTSGRMDNNPVDLTEKDVVDILRSIM